MRIFTVMTVTIWLLALSSSAKAQWLHTTGDEDPFKKGREHLAVTMRAGEMVGFRCTTKDDIALVFVPGERPKPSDATTMAAIKLLPVKLLVIIDDGEKLELDAAIDETPSGESYRYTATGDQLHKVAQAVAGARRRFAVAIEFMDQVLGSRVFGVAGSQRAVGGLIKGCNP